MDPKGTLHGFKTMPVPRPSSRAGSCVCRTSCASSRTTRPTPSASS
jgi:hypothetical protein